MKPSSEKNTIWVAVPYYCALLVPKRGLSRIFFFAQIDLERSRVVYQTMKIWPGRQAGGLARWLKEQGAHGLLSTDQAPKYQWELGEEGIWHWHAGASDVDELISAWIDYVGDRENGFVGAQQMIGEPQRKRREDSHISPRPDTL